MLGGNSMFYMCVPQTNVINGINKSAQKITKILNIDPQTSNIKYSFVLISFPTGLFHFEGREGEKVS